MRRGPRLRRLGAQCFFAAVIGLQLFFVVRAYDDPHHLFGYQPFSESRLAKLLLKNSSVNRKAAATRISPAANCKASGCWTNQPAIVSLKPRKALALTLVKARRKSQRTKHRAS